MTRRRGAARSLLRLRIGFLVVAMVVSVFAVRLFELQGLDANSYAAKFSSEGVVTVKLPARRGSITDRNGVPLATSMAGLMIVADPTLTKNHAAQIATILARRMHLDYIDVLSRLRAPDTHFQFIARRVPVTEARKVVAAIDRQPFCHTATQHGYCGIDTRRDPLREYPSHDVAANVVGFTNAMGQAGEGIELSFDHRLTGHDGKATYEIGGGARIPLGDATHEPPRSGNDVRLTLARDVQWYVQRTLRDAVTSSRADDGSAVVMDVHTGQLLALADYPTFDADNPTATPKSLLGSRALRDMYEPGSVEKVLTTASLLDAHKVTPRTKVVVPPSITRSARVITDDVPHPTWHLTLTGVLARSSNIGAAISAQRLSDERLYHYLRRFGLGSPTGIGLPGESPGALPSWRTWRPINKATIAFGQGVAVNAVQMAAAVNTIANGGVYVAPSLVLGKARMNDGRLVGSRVAGRHRVISRHAAHQETKMMETVTKQGGTAPNTAIAGYDVAGKTGTAQKVNQRCHCYSSAHVVSFVGFAPADQPRFLVYVVIDHPRNGGFGSTDAGPVFKQVMSYLLAKYAVAPDGRLDKTPPLTW